MNKLFILFIVSNLTVISGYSQCHQQVTHTSGTAVISGVNVTVTSSGMVDTFTTYCTSTFPYYIGSNWLTGDSTGSYTFTFSPPIDSLTLNFSGITNQVHCCQEVIKLYVNGNHYSIPSIGTPNGCDTMAELTSSGDIMGCPICGVSGWNGTTITGTISSLTVLDSMIDLITGGALFSLFICPKEVSTALNSIGEVEANIYPNPFTNELTFTLSNNEQINISLYDFLSRQILHQIFTNSTTINTGKLADGIYFYKLRIGNSEIENGKIIKQ